MPRGTPIPPNERQQIIDLRRDPHNHNYKDIAAITGRSYFTVAHVLRDAGLNKEQAQAITIVHDPAGLFQPGPSELNQADLAYMLSLSGLQDGFSFTIGPHSVVTTRDGIYVRDDGWYCQPDNSSTLEWLQPEGAK